MYDDFSALGVKIIAVGWDDPSATSPWVESQSYQYEVWTDQERTLSLYYGAATNSSFVVDRVTRILDSNGTLILEYNDIGFGISAHPAEVLEDCRLLFAD